MAVDNEVELARLAYLRDSHRWEHTCGVWRTVCRCLFGIGVAFFVYKTFQIVAGTTTVFRAVVDAGLKLSADRWVAYLFGGVGLGAYGIEHRNKTRAVEGIKEELDGLRDIVNKKRGRSGLNPRGKPNKKDLKDD